MTRIENEKSNYLVVEKFLYDNMPFQESNIYFSICFVFLHLYFQTQSCGHVYILQTPLICPHLGIEVANSTETNAIPINEPTNGASTFWGKLIISSLFHFKFNLNFQIIYIDSIRLYSDLHVFYHAISIDISYNHKQIGRSPHSRSVSFTYFCRSKNEKIENIQMYKKLYLVNFTLQLYCW